MSIFTFLRKNDNNQSYLDAIFSGRNDYQPKVREILNKYGDLEITNAELRRTPLSLILMTTLSVASFGKIDKNNPYDKLFHLSMVVKLSDGTNILIEKNEVINMEINPKVRPNTEFKQVSLCNSACGRFSSSFSKSGFTLKQLLQRTREKMGDKFFLYSARDYNCQHFIKNILIANNIDTPELINFVEQDTKKLFEGLVYLRKASNTITDIASRLNVVTEGAGNFDVDGREKKPDLKVPNNKLSLNNGLYSDEVEEILHNAGVKNFGGVFSKDRLPTKLKNNWWYIINLQNHDEGEGTHFTCFKYGKSIEYYDSYGFPPPLQILKLERKIGDIKWSNKQIQDINSTACGWYCIARITSKLPYKKFIDSFSNDTFMNDKILEQMLNKNGVEN